MINDLNIEKAILGAIINESTAFIKVCDLIKEDDFYSSQNKEIFKICFNLFSKQSPIDLLTVTQELYKNKSNIKVLYLNELSAMVNSSANIEHHAYLLKEFSIKRKLIKISEKLAVNIANKEDVFLALDEAQSEILKINTDNSGSAIFKLNTQYPEVINQILSLVGQKQKGKISGINTGFDDLNILTDGWQKANLVILAARPGMGKTAFALQMALTAAKEGKKVLFFSLEMNKEQLVKRLLANITGISLTKLITGNLNGYECEELANASNLLQNLNIIIDDTSGISIHKFVSRCRQQQYENKGIDLIIVDYLQLMRSPDNKNREQEITRISQELKNTSKNINCPVIALAQLSRAVESRNDKKPLLSDLRESGSIEQDADIVLFLYRPAYYGITTDEIGVSLDNLCYLIVAKNRQGRLEDIQLNFEGNKMLFTN